MIRWHLILVLLKISTLIIVINGNSDGPMCSSKNYFAKHPGFVNQSVINYLRLSVPIHKALAAFDVSKEIAFFKMETCSGFKICFVTEFNSIKVEDFGAPSNLLWSKISAAFSEGNKRLTQFQEQHRRLFGRSHIEANCVDGYFVIQNQPTQRRFKRNKNALMAIKRNILSQRSGLLSAKHQSNNNQSTKKSRKKRKQSRKKDCKNEMCIRTCLGWKYSPYGCVHLRISCEFKCPCRGCRKRGSAHNRGKFSEFSSDGHSL